MTIKEKVIKVMKDANCPLSAGEVTKLGNFERSEVDKVFNDLKKTGEIESPVRCKWQPKK